MHLLAQLVLSHIVKETAQFVIGREMTERDDLTVPGAAAETGARRQIRHLIGRVKRMTEHGEAA